MRKATHLAVGALCALPVAIDLPWQPAGGAVVLALAGAVVPDYLDLHSDARRLLSHRGVSHSIGVAAVAIAVVFLIIGSLSGVDDPAVGFTSAWVAPLTAAFALGLASHLLLDACTPHGIRPALPFSGWRLRLLPRGMRITTGSAQDRLIGILALAGFVAVASNQLFQ